LNLCLILLNCSARSCAIIQNLQNSSTATSLPSLVLGSV
jgi:hypothetical protein